MMTTRVTVSANDSSDDDDPLVVIKQPLRGDRRDREAEATWLMQAATRGEATGREIVVPLLDFDDGTITTAHCGSSTLRTAKVGPTDAARLLTHLAEGLAVLHDHDMVHGKLSLDHIIVTSRPEQRGPVVVCSPDGHATDPRTDVDGLARCVRALIDQWTGERSVDDNWVELAQRLEGPEPGFSMHRAARAFEALGDEPHPTVSPDPGRPGRSAVPTGVRGLSIAAAVVVVAIIGVSVLDRRADRQALDEGVMVDVDGQRYQVGAADDVALARPVACDDGPALVVLDADDSVWVFTSTDAASPEPVAVVPGATMLEHRGGQRCPEVWATGPAGAVPLDLGGS